MTDQQPEEHESAAGDESLPDGLRQAVEFARRRHVSPEMAARWRERFNERCGEQQFAPTAAMPPIERAVPRRRFAWWALTASAALAAAVWGASVVMRPDPDPSRPSAVPPESFEPTPFYSSVRRIPLSPVAWRQLEADLTVVEEEVDEVSKSLQWSALRQEIARTLDEFSIPSLEQ